MASEIDIIGHIQALMDEARRTRWRVVRLRVGDDLKQAFLDQAGISYDPAQETYFGIPISFDAIDPATVISETEPES